MRTKVVIAILAVVLTGFAVSDSAFAQATHRLKGVAGSRPTPQFGLWTWLADELDKRTNGQVKLEMVSWPEAGYTGFEMVRVARGGLMDFVDVLPSSSSGDVPVLEGVDLPGLYADFETSVKAHAAFLPAFKKYEDKIGGVVLGAYLWPYGIVFSRKPVRSPEDLKGLKVRASGTAESEFLRALGAEPVSLPFSEVYTALERGTVDAAITGTYSGFAVKWYEVTKYMVDLNKGSNCGMLVASKRTWDRLPADVRSVLTKLGEEFTEKGWEVGRRTSQEGIDKNKERGMELILPSPAVAAAIRDAVMKGVVPNWAKRAGADAKPVFNQYLAPHTGFTLP